MEDPKIFSIIKVLKIFNIITFCKIFLKKMEEMNGRSKNISDYKSIRMK